MESAYNYFGKILGTDPLVLEKMDMFMSSSLSKKGVLDELRSKNELEMERVLAPLSKNKRNFASVSALLRNNLIEDEKELLRLLDSIDGESEFDRAVILARSMTNLEQGFFLKKEKGKEILRKRTPNGLLKHFGFKNVEQLLKNLEVTEIFSALRFMETDEWMHTTFDSAYSGFSKEDFEYREVELKVLGDQWKEVAEKFVAKKHHNVSHLKEFGVIFLNPVREDTPGKMIRDFALLLHYFHEINFYSKLFEQYKETPDFSKHLKSLLRGDVKEAKARKEGDWLIVQRYLWKIDPKDERLFIPHVNPESLHWHRAERDLAEYKNLADIKFDLKIWNDKDWVAGFFDNKLISFDLEDVAMGYVAYSEEKSETFTYHQHEALWTHIFRAYVGGEGALEALLLKNYEKGIISI